MAILQPAPQAFYKLVKAGRVLFRFAVALVAVFGAAISLAWDCGVPPPPDAGGVMWKLGRADLAFVGKIERLGLIKIGGFGGDSVRAIVLVERMFKGEAKRAIAMYVDSRIIVGQRVIFYAARESADEVRNRIASLPKDVGFHAPERMSAQALGAYGMCSPERMWVLADTQEGRSELRHLDNLPAEGSGGTLQLRVKFYDERTWLPRDPATLGKLPITLTSGSVIRKADADKVNGQSSIVTFSNLPEGIYQVNVPQVSGFTTSNDKFTVIDRDLHEHTVVYVPNAFLEVKLAQADGTIIETAAAYKLTRVDLPSSNIEQPFSAPKEIQFNTSASIEKAKDGIRLHVGAPPGKYTLALVLTQNKRRQPTEVNNHSDAVEFGRQIITSPTLGVINLRAGNNTIIFKLPPTVVPAKVRFVAKLPAANMKGKTLYAATLVHLNTPSDSGFNITQNTRPDLDGGGRFFNALPGQTWAISAGQYEGVDFGKGLHILKMLIVRKDTRVTLKMEKFGR